MYPIAMKIKATHAFAENCAVLTNPFPTRHPPATSAPNATVSTADNSFNVLFVSDNNMKLLFASCQKDQHHTTQCTASIEGSIVDITASPTPFRFTERK